MNAITEERMKSAKLAMSYMKDAKNRNTLREQGFGPSSPIIVCEWETLVSEVHSMLRVQDGSPRILILIRKGEETVCALGATSSVPDSAFLAIAGVSPKSEIGMVYDALRAQDRFGDLRNPAASTTNHVGNYELAVA